MPDTVVGLGSPEVGQRAASEFRRKPSFSERRLARSAVGDDHDKPMLAKLFDKLFDLLVAAEEAVGFLLPHRRQANERLFERPFLVVPIRLEDRLKEPVEFVAVAKRISDAVIKPSEGRQRVRADSSGKDRNEEKILVLRRAQERGPHLYVDPVDHPARADIDHERGGVLCDRLLYLRLPLAARPKIIFVEPDLEAGTICFQQAFEGPRRLRIGAGMAQENEWRSIEASLTLSDENKLRGRCRPTLKTRGFLQSRRPHYCERAHTLKPDRKLDKRGLMRAASGAAYPFNQGPLSRTYRPFIWPTLTVAFGSNRAAQKASAGF